MRIMNAPTTQLKPLPLRQAMQIGLMAIDELLRTEGDDEDHTFEAAKFTLRRLLDLCPLETGPDLTNRSYL
jgi:hypothetical protein